MKVGIRTPSLRKRVSARTSVSRYVRHSAGVKMPKGYGFITDPDKYIYNKIYNKTTFGFEKLFIGAIAFIIIAIIASL